MKLTPEVRALYGRARQPLLRIVLGGALMAPAAVLMASGQLDALAERQQTLQAERTAEARLPTDAVAQEWTARTLEALERERKQLVASFAQEFGISVHLAENIQRAAEEENIAPRVAFGLVRAESSFRTKAVSPVGAVGLTQLLPSTARWLVPGTTRSDLMNPETNLRVGFKYLRYLLDRYEGNEQLALTAYNRGPGTVSKLLRRGRDPDNGYYEKVMTGNSTKHVRLMNAKFGRKGRRS